MEETKLEEVIEKEEGKWRSKMIKVFGDLHPYTFYVTYGHSEDSFMSKNADFLEREIKKSEPFDKLIKICDADKEAEGEFHALLSKLEKEKPVPSLNEALHELKKECAQVLKLFDKTVSLCKNYFNLEFNECRKRTERQKLLQKPMLSQVEKFISNVEETGDLELRSLREHISTCMFDLGSSWSKRVDDLYEEKQKKPLVIELWCESAYTLSSKEVRDTFLADQKEMTILWQKAFDDLIMLATELEKYRYNYNLTKSRLEREVFWMSREYRENMPELTRIQRNFAFTVDRKVILKKELKSLGKEISLEQCKMEEIKNKFSKKINCMRLLNKLAKERLTFKHQNIFDIKKSEVIELLATILQGDKFIHEEILNVTQEDVDLSFLKPEDIKKIHAVSSPRVSVEAQMNNDLKRKIPTLHDDEFADAFRTLVSSRDLVSLLNLLTDELGYTLDLRWVQYIAETLDICNEIKWIELFKVFQINFVEDIKELKEHMTKYCKLSDNGEVVFDIKGAVDGFLHFVWLKRQSSFSGISHNESELKFSAEFWQSFEKALPKTCVWDCVTEILEKYRELLKTRCNLLELKLNLVAENEEFEKYLKNYNAYVYL